MNSFLHYIEISVLIIGICESNQLYLAKCIVNIIERHFEQYSAVAVSFSDEHLLLSSNKIESIIRELYEIEYFPLSIRNTDRQYNGNITAYKYQGYIFFSKYKHRANIIQDLEYQILNHTKSRYWNPYGKFIIVADTNSFPKQLAQDMFAILWKWSVLKAIVVLPTVQFDNNEITKNNLGTPVYDIYAWYPFGPQCQCGKIQNVIVLDTWILNNDNIGFFSLSTPLFAERVPSLLNDCSITISTFEFAPLVMKDTKGNFVNGIEIKLLNELLKRSNLSVLFHEQTDGTYWGVELQNGSWNGLTGEIMNRKTDLALGNWYYRCHVINSIECTMPYLVDEARWYIPCAKPYPRWASLTRVFKLSLWLGFLTSFIIVAVVMYIVVRFSSQISEESAANNAYASFAKCCLNFWAIILEESASNNPPRVFVIRAMFLTWVLYCWAINTVYQTYLTSFLVDPGLQHQLSSEEEMLTSGMFYNIILHD